MPKNEHLEYKKYSDQLVSWLVELGYTHCFFVAGGNIMHLLDGVRKTMTCIPVVHEVSAGIGAEYFNESNSEKKAFALVTAGPGVSNIVTAMSGAWLESRELLVIAGQVKATDLASGGLRQRGIQEIDGVGITRAVSKAAIQIKSPISKSEFVETVKLGMSGRPGPIFVEICLDAQGAQPIAEIEQITEGVKGKQSSIDLESFAIVLEKLKNAQRPLLLIGGGISRLTTTLLQKQLQKLSIPLMTTWNGADRLDSRSDNYFGRPNTWGQRAANLILAQADVVVALGTRLGLQQTGFNWQEFGKNAFVVHVDIDQVELIKGHPKTDLKICVDANVLLSKIIEAEHPSFGEWNKYVRRVRHLLPLNESANETAEGFISTQGFFEQISKLANEDDVIIPCSSGGANSAAMQVLSQKLGQIIITNKGLASMGYGLAGAIGASLAHPHRRTFLFEGDGGFAQNLQELATVKVNQLPIKIFIFANNGYGSIRMTQKNYFDGAYLGCDTQTGLGFPDWSVLFQSFGIDSVTIGEDWASNNEVLMRLSDPYPCGFIVPTDPLQTYWPKIQSRVVAGGGMESNPLHSMTPDLETSLHSQVSVYLE